MKTTSERNGSHAGPAAATPPCSLEAERAVLGCVVRNNRCLPDVLEHFTAPENFYAYAHRLIWQAVLDLTGRGMPADVVTVGDLLKGRAELREFGDADSSATDYLLRLTTEAPPVAHAKHHAKMVKDKATLRELINACIDVLEDCYAPGTDAAEVMEKAERELARIALRGAAADARPIGHFVREVCEQYERVAAGGEKAGLPYGFVDLDRKTCGMHTGELILVAARTSVGKTAFALGIARNVALAGANVYFSSLEQSGHELAARLICAHCQLDSQRWRAGKLYPEEKESLSMSRHELEGAGLYVGDRSFGLGKICAEARRHRHKHKVGLVVVDYLQLVQVEGRRNQQRYEQVGEIAAKLKELARELEVPVIALAQLKREAEERPDGEPELRDLRESGNLEQDSDVALMLYRPKSEPAQGDVLKVVVKIAKQRNGPQGYVPLYFLRKNVRFENCAEEWTRGNA